MMNVRMNVSLDLSQMQTYELDELARQLFDERCKRRESAQGDFLMEYRGLLRQGDKLKAVKLYRERNKCSLTDAYEFVTSL